MQNKRVQREIETLRNKNFAYDITLRQERKDNKDCFATLLYTKTAKDNLVCIHLDHNSYPFYPPKVTINDQNYSSFFACRSPRIISVMRKLITWNENFCFCCHTILCNWSPVNSVEHLLQEIENYNLIKRNITYHLIYNEVPNKRENEKTSINNLPRDVLRHIFLFLVDKRFLSSFFLVE
jgi:hypothetical protein